MVAADISVIYLALDRHAADLEVKGAALGAAGHHGALRARAVAARPQRRRLAVAHRDVGPAQAARAHNRVAALAEAKGRVGARAAVLQRDKRARVAAALWLGERAGQRAGARGGESSGEGGDGSKELHC